jgi:hypothetical protein
MMDIDLEEQFVWRITGNTPVDCVCDKCINLCKKSPCTGTPAEILRLINNGFIHRIQPAFYAAYVLHPITMYTVCFDQAKGSCSFLLNDRCELHTVGLKSMEGRMTDCRIPRRPKGKIPLPYAVALTWTVQENAKTIKLIQKAMSKRVGIEMQIYGFME